MYYDLLGRRLTLDRTPGQQRTPHETTASAAGILIGTQDMDAVVRLDERRLQGVSPALR